MRNRTTNYSPAELLYGTKLATPTVWIPPAEASDLEFAIQEQIAAMRKDIPELRSLGFESSIAGKIKE
ncbi:hypothetical protein AX774_g7666 [Zancudomyces culisetae]|uniref:Uncharacterized protein n=1 Tax=Zancudomyces culisetae TaxID=1213189 RepID=A0A1R1PDC6_ZANCU|nr:hypothetical protein AX774_g7666 [Zancudomyces culisetae]|eukprot:OMH78933.1 hypothetical protein AX774_g7666 [Zancudomyces culisetae]